MGREREFNERIPTHRENNPIFLADQIEVKSVGTAPLLAEEKEEEE